MLRKNLLLFLNIGFVLSSFANEKTFFKKSHFFSTRYDRKASVDTCPININLEVGSFTNWETNTGVVRTGPGLANTIIWNNPVWTPNNGLPIRHEIIDRNNSNPKLDPWGNFPVNPPFGGGRYAVKLGSDQDDPTIPPPILKRPNALAEGIRYKINVPSNDADSYGITFSYAVVFENPNHPNNIHTYEEQPRFITRIYEVGGDTLSCANFTFVASEPLPGFDISPIAKIDSAFNRYPGGVNFAPVKYKPWSSVFVNLSRYKGKTLYLEFITADCTKTGHFGYAYLDVLECVVPTKAEITCSKSGPDSVTLVGPAGFKTYEWWNSNYTKKIGSGDTLRTSGLVENEKVNVRVIPFDRYGCEDTLTATVKAKSTSIPAIRYPTLYGNINTDINLKARNIFNSTYTWVPKTGLNNDKIINPVFNYDKELEYLINIQTADGCQTVDTVKVLVGDDGDIMVPDAFSPNDDGRNDKLDMFLKRVKKIHFWVFNRWGQLMFETTNPAQRWDGRFNGKPQPLETYVWIAEIETYSGRKIRKRGQTVLVR